MNFNQLFLEINTLVLDNKPVAIRYRKFYQVCEGVECQEYSIVGDESKDLAVVDVQPGYKTPLQLVKDGSTTLEIPVKGKGRLFIKSSNGKITTHSFDAKKSSRFTASLKVGDIIQWHADTKTPLQFMELCSPPYEEGRFENIIHGDERFIDFLEG